MLFCIQLIVRKKSPLRGFRGLKSHHFICPNDQIYTIHHGGNGQVSVLCWFLDFKQVPQASISPPTSTIFFQLFIHVEFQVCQSFALHRFAHQEKLYFVTLLLCCNSKSKSIPRFFVLFCFEDYSDSHIQKFNFCKTQIS